MVNHRTPLGAAVKRAFDLLGCVAAIVIFGPVVLLFSWLIKREDGGPVLFVQERIGQAGKPFRCFKFRTMRDEQVTRVGRWLRSTGLDELAQFVNILRGEMSVVGPRPLTREDVERLGWDGGDRRFQMLPGMTGLAQLYVGESLQKSLACDRYYAAHQSLWLDIWIVLMSFCVNLIGKRRFRKLRDRIRGVRTQGTKNHEVQIHPAGADRG